jgi:hypothetical protein
MKILILEDNEERIAAFEDACGALSAKARVWRNAHRMIAEVGEALATADLLSLDHDLNDDSGEDAGCGMDVARYLAHRKPTCPILLHTSNTSASWSMLNELKEHGWDVRRVPPVTMGAAWIREDWMPVVGKIKEEAEANTAAHGTLASSRP